jgi:hypothetical protein
MTYYPVKDCQLSLSPDESRLSFVDNFFNIISLFHSGCSATIAAGILLLPHARNMPRHNLITQIFLKRTNHEALHAVFFAIY